MNLGCMSPRHSWRFGHRSACSYGGYVRLAMENFRVHLPFGRLRKISCVSEAARNQFTLLLPPLPLPSQLPWRTSRLLFASLPTCPLAFPPA